MTDATLTRVLSGLEEIASRLDVSSAQALQRAPGKFVDSKYAFAFGYLRGKVEVAAEDLRKDIKLLRDNQSLGGDTDGTAAS